MIQECFQFLKAKFPNPEFRGSPQTIALKRRTPLSTAKRESVYVNYWLIGSRIRAFQFPLETLLGCGVDFVPAQLGGIINSSIAKWCIWSDCKPEVKFQHGGRLFSETGSSNNSAVGWDISSKFGIQTDFDLLKRVPSLNPQPEVDLRRYGRHLEKSIWCHTIVSGKLFERFDGSIISCYANGKYSI